MTADTADEPARNVDTALELVIALHRLVRSLRAAVGLQPTQLLVLAQLMEAGSLRIGELASRVPCSQPTATTVANSLELDGLVRRVRDTTDGRAIRLEITDAGRTAMRSVVHGQAQKLQDRMNALDPSDRDLVEAALPILREMSR